MDEMLFSSSNSDDSLSQHSTTTTATLNTQPTITHRKRGRPPKATTFSSHSNTNINNNTNNIIQQSTTNTRKRGRPKKRSPSIADDLPSIPSTSAKESPSDTDIPSISIHGKKRGIPVTCVNTRDRAGRTPIFKYCSLGQFDTVLSLITSGAYINVNDYAGWTPLHEACLAGHENIIILLLTHGANVNSKGGNLDTPLHDAVQNCHINVIEILLRHGASLESLNADNKTPLDVCDDENIKNFLDSWSTNIENSLTRDANGQTSLHRAVKTSNIHLVRDCLKYGSDIDARDNSAWTALHQAALDGNVDICSLLLSHGCEVDPQAVDLDTPLINAAVNNHKEVVDILLRYGANVNITDSRGRKAIDVCTFAEVKNLLRAPVEAYLPFIIPTHKPILVSTNVNSSTLENNEKEILQENDTDNQMSDSGVKPPHKSLNSNFAWGGLDEKKGEFESSREERKFQALLKKLADADSTIPGENNSNLKSENMHKNEHQTSKKEREKSPSMNISNEEKKLKMDDSSNIPKKSIPTETKEKAKGKVEKVEIENLKRKKQPILEIKTITVEEKEIKVIPTPSPRKERPIAKISVDSHSFFKQNSLGILFPESKKHVDTIVSPETKDTSTILSEVPIRSPSMNVNNASDIQQSRKKLKKKSWLGISGYQSIDNGSLETESKSDQLLVSNPISQVLPVQEAMQNFFKKHCLPLFIIILPSLEDSFSTSRFFLDIQLGLFFGYSSGRAFIDSCSGLKTRVAVSAEKEELEKSSVSEIIYSSMLFANQSAGKWLKWVPTRNGQGKGLKITEIDIHFIREEDVRSRIENRIGEYRPEWFQFMDDESRFMDEISIGSRRPDGFGIQEIAAQVSEEKFYVHKLKRHVHRE